MSYWIKHITNKLIFFNKLSDRYETAKFLSLVFLILISGIFIHLTTNMTGLFCGIGILFIDRTDWLDDFKQTLNILKEIDSNPENVRCVFFFDN